MSLVDLIEHCSTETCDLKGSFTPVTEATAEDIRAGMELFVGTRAQAAGGPSCLSCHQVRGAKAITGGGTLSVDLTHVFARLGDEGLDAALRNPAFPLMNKVYGDRPLEAEEVLALRAFLYEANRGALDVGATDDPFSVPLAGFLGTVAALAALNAAWSRRLRGVRRPLVSEGGRTS